MSRDLREHVPDDGAMGPVVCCPNCWRWTEFMNSATCKQCGTPLILSDGRSVAAALEGAPAAASVAIAEAAPPMRAERVSLAELARKEEEAASARVAVAADPPPPASAEVFADAAPVGSPLELPSLAAAVEPAQVEQLAPTPPAAPTPPPPSAPTPPTSNVGGIAQRALALTRKDLDWVSLTRWAIVAYGALVVIGLLAVGLIVRHFSVPVTDPDTGQTFIQTYDLGVAFVFVAAVAVVVFGLLAWLTQFGVVRLLMMIVVLIAAFNAVVRVVDAPLPGVAAALLSLLLDAGMLFLLVMSLVAPPRDALRLQI